MTRLMSFCTTPNRPMDRAVKAPTASTRVRAVSESSNSGDSRATMKIPAVTMVAAWMSAEMGGRALHGVGQPDMQGRLG